MKSKGNTKKNEWVIPHRFFLAKKHEKDNKSHGDI